MSVPYSFYTDDIADNAIRTEKILNSTILNEDVADNTLSSAKILNATILNEDIADGTVNLATKVTDSLSVKNGGTGKNILPVDRILVGNGELPIKPKIIASPDASVIITQTADSIKLKAVAAPVLVTSDPAGTFNVGNLPAGTTYTSNAINAFVVNYGDIIIGSIDTSLQGCMLSAYVSQPNVIRVSIYNGTGGAVNLGTVNVKVFIVK